VVNSIGPRVAHEGKKKRRTGEKRRDKVKSKVKQNKKTLTEQKD